MIVYFSVQSSFGTHHSCRCTRGRAVVCKSLRQIGVTLMDTDDHTLRATATHSTWTHRRRQRRKVCIAVVVVTMMMMMMMMMMMLLLLLLMMMMMFIFTSFRLKMKLSLLRNPARPSLRPSQRTTMHALRMRRLSQSPLLCFFASTQRRMPILTRFGWSCSRAARMPCTSCSSSCKLRLGMPCEC